MLVCVLICLWVIDVMMVGVFGLIGCCCVVMLMVFSVLLVGVVDVVILVEVGVVMVE